MNGCRKGTEHNKVAQPMLRTSVPDDLRALASIRPIIGEGDGAISGWKQIVFNVVKGGRPIDPSAQSPPIVSARSRLNATSSSDNSCFLNSSVSFSHQRGAEIWKAECSHKLIKYKRSVRCSRSLIALKFSYVFKSWRSGNLHFTSLRCSRPFSRLATSSPHLNEPSSPGVKC